MEDDDDDDFQQLFFQECEELLGSLQARLEELQSGDFDKETINAAFRAVHSVKGGAAAFGFDNLITFAHTFENVMDLARSDELPITEEFCSLMLRAGDVMELLIEKAQADDASPTEKADRVLEELKVMSGVKPDETADNSGEAAAVETAPAEEVVEEEDDEPALNLFDVILKPDDSFFQAGHDLLKVTAAARKIGLTDVVFNNELPTIDALVFDECPFTWTFKFETEKSREDIESFFHVYEAVATFEFDEEDEVEEAETAAPAETPAIGAQTAESAPEAAPDAVNTPQPKPAAEAATAKESAPAKSQRARAPATKTLRVDLPKIDRLVNLVGEIVITQAVLAQKISETDSASDHEFGHSVEAIARQTRELQESVMAIRAQPVKTVFGRLPRVVRDLCDTLGKDVKLVMEGEQTEVDATVIEELYEPLTHMLRNSMDHGIEMPETRKERGKSEQGTIYVSAAHRGERVILTIKDDGAGINREVVLRKAVEKGLVPDPDVMSPEEIDNLIFHPGFSTAKEVSSVSGRGVGMDVVRKKILELGGRPFWTE